jgi:hypothetical protein
MFKMKSFSNLRWLILLLFCQSFYAQKNSLISPVDTISYWKKENTIGLDISEIAFVNWNAGGNNSITGLLKGNFTRLYRKGNFKWNNELIARYGINKQDGSIVKKTDDGLQLNSTLGYKFDSISNWYYTGKYNFNTQFTNGYAYPNTDKAISKLFAPAYFFLGIGAEYANKKNKFNIYLSPLTVKTTLVLDGNLANQGAYGVEKATYDANGKKISSGKLSKSELGVLFTAYHKDEVYKNIVLENRLALYSDYINKFGNIDVDWQFQVDLIVNKYVRTNIGAHIIYDDDIKAKEDLDGVQITIGPKLQLKQMLGVGLTYSF